MSAAQEKIDRVLKALNHEEPDRVPVGEFFWTNFVRRCKREMDVGDDFDPYRHWDLDMVVLTANMDPRITGIEVLEDSDERKLVKTGFGATIERLSALPMPHFAKFEYESWEAIEALEFEDPYDPRRYLEKIDDQINSVGDELNLGLPAWIERVDKYAADMCVFGGTCEPHELVWRIMGSENVLMKMAEDPDRFARIIDRLGDFGAAIADAQIKAAGGKLNGMYVWGDIAYVNGMMFNPKYWNEVYKPQLRKITDVIHGHGLKAIYHSDGDLHTILDDLIDGGIDGLNPLERKAKMDVLEFKRSHGSRVTFNGNLDVQVLERNDPDLTRELVLTRLNAAKGGGYILQSDHSMPDNVAPATYDHVIQLAREYGVYPLDLGEYDRDVSPPPEEVKASPGTQFMKRYGMVVEVREDKIEEYKKLHAAVWPGVLDMIKQCNIRNYSIYLRKLPDGKHYLFSYFEYVGEDFAVDGAKMAADPETRRWWDVCKPCHEPLPDRAEGEWWADMEEVFHQD